MIRDITEERLTEDVFTPAAPTNRSGNVEEDS